MSGYVVAGYIISIGTLFLYGLSVAHRVRAARRRAPGVIGLEVSSPSGGQPGGLGISAPLADPATERR